MAPVLVFGFDSDVAGLFGGPRQGLGFFFAAAVIVVTTVNSQVLDTRVYPGCTHHRY
jgi:hypothetical protein